MTRTSLLYLVAELGPVLAFFIAGRFTDFFGAATVLIIATIAACVLSWVVEKRIPTIPVISAAFVVGSALLTLQFRNPDILIFADTVFYATLGLILAGSLWRRAAILKKLFDGVFAMTDEGWRKLTWRWFWFMVVACIANETVRQLASPDFWIDYRFYKTIVMIAFASYQFRLSARYRIPEESNWLGIRIHVPTAKTTE